MLLIGQSYEPVRQTPELPVMVDKEQPRRYSSEQGIYRLTSCQSTQWTVAFIFVGDPKVDRGSSLKSLPSIALRK
jgi:hypothetical protein